MPKVTFSQESIERTFTLAPDGLYIFKLNGFKPAKSEKGDSVNFNPVLELVGTTDGSPVPKNEDGSNMTSQYWGGLNSKADGIINDFVHAFGLAMEGPSDSLEIPGTFEGPGFEVAEAGKTLNWEYRGPLVGKRMTAMLINQVFEGKPGNKIKFYVCAVQDCNTRFPKTRHSTDLAKQK